MKKIITLAILLLLVLGCSKPADEPVDEPPPPPLPPPPEPEIMDLSLTSPAFEDGQPIPQKYTCWGDNANPPLKIDNIPTGTQSLALIMDDPDAPSGTWVHWLVWNMDPGTTDIKEDHYFINEGKNSWYESKYGGPCPPSGTHRYFFKLYALDEQLNLPSGTQKKHLEGAMKGHILGQGELIGTVSK